MQHDTPPPGSSRWPADGQSAPPRAVPPRPAPTLLPPAGTKVKFCTRLPAELVREIEAFRLATHRNKEGALLALLLAGLAALSSSSFFRTPLTITEEAASADNGSEGEA